MSDQTTVQESQNALLERIAAGDREAVAEFYDQTAGSLFSVSLRILGDAGEAEEVIQDVFVQIWEKAGSFDPALGSAFHWALSIARHRSIDRIRARQRRSHLLQVFQESIMADAPPSAATGNALDSDDIVKVRSALMSLPSDQRQALEMAFFAGQTHIEIAETLQQPLGTIKARIRRGMLKLRDSLQEYA